MNILLSEVSMTPDEPIESSAVMQHFAGSDGEFMARRPTEVAVVIDEQLERILDDGIVDGAEELEQVELQSAFGLAYDDYLLVSRRAFERVHAELTRAAPHDPVAREKLRLLEPMYRLVTSRPRTLGALF